MDTREELFGSELSTPDSATGHKDLPEPIGNAAPHQLRHLLSVPRKAEIQ
jgi:hypothetical protein